MATDKTERYELSRLGASPVKNSGRGKIQKGDGILYGDSGEAMYTCDVKEYSNSYALSEKNLAKVTADARTNGLTYPMLHVVLGEDEPRTRWVAIPEVAFLEMWEVFKKTI